MTYTPGIPASSMPAPSDGPARYQQIDQGQLEAWRRKGARNIGFGILWLVAGLLITVITMSSSSSHGGFYVIAFGPMIGGAIQIFSGYRTHRRGTVTPPSPATPLAPAHRPSAATPSSSASSQSPGAGPGASRSAAGSVSPSAGPWHPARSITRGMSRDEVRRRLGEPTTNTPSGSTGSVEAGDIWTYEDCPAGQHTEIALATSGHVQDVVIRSGAAPDRAAADHTTSDTAGRVTRGSGERVDDAGPTDNKAAGTTPRLLRRSAVRAQAQGDLDEAKVLHRQVIDTGHPTVAPASMLDLAQLVEADGDTCGAARLFEQAAGSGDGEQAAFARTHLERLRPISKTPVAVAAAANPEPASARAAGPVRTRGAAPASSPAASSGRRKHAWAEELIEEHLCKVEEHDPVLAARRTWPLLRRRDVLDYVMSGDRPQWNTGRVGTRGAMFDDLYVAVSNLPTHRPPEMRPLLQPEGYTGLLRRLITESRTIEKRIDVVHWTLGSSHQGWAAHLLYMPPPNGIPLSWDKGEHTLFPWDLFLPEERPNDMRHSF